MGTLPPVDAAPVGGGDGLAERVITDAALWPDVGASEAVADRPSFDGDDGRADGDVDGDRARDGRDDDGDGANDGPDAPNFTCDLLAANCPGREGCYPYPFEGDPSGGAFCAFQGAGGPSVPCQSQLECDGTTLCSAPGQPDSVCQLRCQRSGPQCPIGMACFPFFNYTDVGICL